jgi:hypothetical protein
MLFYIASSISFGAIAGGTFFSIPVILRVPWIDILEFWKCRHLYAGRKFHGERGDAMGVC